MELSEAAAAASVNQQISTGGPSPTPVPSLVAEDILVLKDLIDVTVSDASQVSDGGLLLCYRLFHALSLQQQQQH